MMLPQAPVVNDSQWSDSLPLSIAEAWNCLMARLDECDSCIRDELLTYFVGLWEQQGVGKVLPMPRITIGPLHHTKNAWGAAVVGLPQLYVDDAVTSWPPQAIEVLLAHEVAHFYHMAIDRVKPNEDDEEVAVDDRIATWGYDSLILDMCGAFQLQMNRAPSWDEVCHHRKNGRPLKGGVNR